MRGGADGVSQCRGGTWPPRTRSGLWTARHSAFQGAVFAARPPKWFEADACTTALRRNLTARDVLQYFVRHLKLLNGIVDRYH
eukprot:6193364-Pleurochrysis_carterae.AAC.3